MSGRPASGGALYRMSDGTSQEAWSREAVAERLEEAARTLKSLPARGCFPQGLSARWPEPVRSFWETWNALPDRGARKRYSEARLENRSVPGAAAIDRMDEALAWLTWVPERRKVRVLWARALGVRPTVLARTLGCHRDTVTVWQRQGLEAIARRLNEDPPRS